MDVPPLDESARRTPLNSKRPELLLPDGASIRKLSPGAPLRKYACNLTALGLTDLKWTNYMTGQKYCPDLEYRYE